MLSGFSVTSHAQLTDHLVILPKRFRRFAEYSPDSDGSVALSGFNTFPPTTATTSYHRPDRTS